MNALPLAAGSRAVLCAALLAALPLVASAQNPAPRPMPPDSARSRPEQPMSREGREGREGRPMGPEDSRRNGMEPRTGPTMEDARLDSLVTAMHRATGTKKTAAMERVIDALLADRKAMHERMMQMMQTMQARRGRTGEGDRNCMPGGPGCPMKDSSGHDQPH